MKIIASLAVSVWYETNGTDPKVLLDQLKQVIDNASANGALSGTTDAEVDEYQIATGYTSRP